MVALSMLEVNIEPSAAIGTAVQFRVCPAGTLSDFAAGLMILLYRPYDIGIS